ncbi:hypothetical protein N9N28_16735 [Rubripirellula amarantea]|nr:hypothetical protein [Rubripirellula amarantea]
MSTFTDAELTAFLDEALTPARSSEIESALRSDATLRNRLIEVRGRETAGLHSIGAIWRRARLSCPNRSELGQFVLGTLSSEQADYIQFHLDEMGCRYCQANLADLKSAADAAPPTAQRRQKYFQTSAGYLRRDK